MLEALQAKYGSIVCPVTIPASDGTGVIDLVHNIAYETNGNKTAKVAVPAADAGKAEELREALMETAAGATEELMEKYFEEMTLSEEELVTGIKAGLKDRSVVPVFCGVGTTGVGTQALLQAILDYVPAPDEVEGIDPNGPTAGLVFKTVSDQFGKYNFIKLVSGKLTADMSLRNSRTGNTDKLGRLYTMCGKKTTEVKDACCGDIVAIGKMDWKTGDTVCDPKAEIELPPIEIAEPCYSMCISPKTKGQDDKIANGLGRLNEEDISFTVVNNAETPPDGPLRRRRYPARRPLRQAEEPLRCRERAQARPRALPREDQGEGRSPWPPQEADRRQRSVRRCLDPLRAPGGV